MFTIEDDTWHEYIDEAVRMGVARGYEHRQTMIAEGGDPDADDAWDDLPGPLSGDPIPAPVARDLMVGNDAPDDWAMLEGDVANAYRAGYYEALAGDAVPCETGRMWLTGEPYCMTPGTYCDCLVVIRN